MQIEPGPKSYERYEYVEPAESVSKAPSSKPRGIFTLDWIIKFVVIMVILSLAVAVVSVLLTYFSRLFMYLIAGFVIAYLIRPMVDRMQGIGMRRVPAILISFVLVFGIVSLLITFLVPFFGNQISEVTQQITEEQVNEWAISIETFLRARIPAISEGSVIEGVRSISSTLFQEQRFTAMVESVFNVFTDIFYAILVIPFVTFFFLRDATKISNAALRLVPNRYFEVTLSIIEKIETRLGRYIRGLLLQCTAVALIATSLLLLFTDMRYTLVVGIFTGVANTIPYFGPFMGVIAGSIVTIADTGGFTMIPGLLVAMGLTQIVDNIVIQPLIFSNAAKTHPLVILFVVLIGAQLAGIVGMLIAIPVTTTILVTVKQVLWSIRNYRILHVT